MIRCSREGVAGPTLLDSRWMINPAGSVSFGGSKGSPSLDSNYRTSDHNPRNFNPGPLIPILDFPIPILISCVLDRGFSLLLCLDRAK